MSVAEHTRYVSVAEHTRYVSVAEQNDFNDINNKGRTVDKQGGSSTAKALIENLRAARFACWKVKSGFVGRDGHYRFT